jgi:probable HAF family extracellular repeat protein
VVGESCDQNGNCRGFLWQNGVMTDINSLVLPGSTLYLVNISDINDRGEIAGYAYDPNTGDLPGFLAIPCDASHGNVEGCEVQAEGATAVVNGHAQVTLPESVRQRLRLAGLCRFHFRPIRTHNESKRSEEDHQLDSCAAGENGDAILRIAGG